MKKWLVTVSGSNPDYTPSRVIHSRVIKLPNGETPVDWFLSNPKMYYYFDFTPDALINFWDLTLGNDNKYIEQ
jgi:hypothetical protein